MLWLAAAVVLVLLGLWGAGKLPIEQISSEVGAVRSRLEELVQVLGPSGAGPAASPVQQETPVSVAAVALTPSPAERTAPPTVRVPSSEPTEAPTAFATLAETATATTPSARAVLTSTVTPTPELTPTATATPTLTTTATPTPTAAPATSTATPSVAGQVTYRVQSGDTLSSIAVKFGITWEALAAANGLTATSVLRIGQELKVPVPGVSLPPTATPRPPATATPSPPTPTPEPALPAPALRSPGDQTPYSGGDAFVELAWDPVPGIGAGQQYQVVIRWTEQGAPQEHFWFTTANSTRVPLWLFGRADQPTRQYTWFVRVVQVTTDGRGGELVVPLSPPSAVRTLYWN